jgi:hypothetical protein
MQFDPVPSPLKLLRIWNAHSHGFSFVITLEQLPGDAVFSGYTASWKNRRADIRPFGKQPANRIDGGPWKTFTEAEAACDATLKQLRQRS